MMWEKANNEEMKYVAPPTTIPRIEIVMIYEIELATAETALIVFWSSADW